jgi:hypothetical protein
MDKDDIFIKEFKEAYEKEDNGLVDSGQKESHF